MSAGVVTNTGFRRSAQDFFTSLLQGPLLERADPERGRFRSLLLKALQDFLGHASEKLHTHKRGGGMKFVSWDDWMAEAPSQLSLSAASAQFVVTGATIRSALGCDSGRTCVSAPARGMPKQKAG